MPLRGMNLRSGKNYSSGCGISTIMLEIMIILRDAFRGAESGTDANLY